MTNMKTLLVMICMMGLSPFAFAEHPTPKRVDPADAKNHIGEVSTVCGRVVDAKVFKNGIAGYGTPIQFDLDQPEPNPVFYFIAFGPQVAATQPVKTQQSVDAYNGKRVCVTGKITSAPSGGAPFILAANRSRIKLQPEAP
jgi:hypothetical protein